MADSARPDARKTLATLRRQWEGCTRCELGHRRDRVRARMVHGEGTPRGILFVGDAPSKAQEAQGQIPVGDYNGIFERVLEGLNFRNYYITHVVSCRSAIPKLDQETGLPRVRRNFKTGQDELEYEDTPPAKPALDACRARLMEEIYLVDPVVICTLGGPATAAVRGTPNCSITKERGNLQVINIPGAGYRPSLTPKGKWARKVRGELVYPVEQAMVQYLLLPTFHPRHAYKEIAKERAGDNPFQLFGDDLATVRRIYDTYHLEVNGYAVEETDYSLPSYLQGDIAQDDHGD